MSSFHLLSDTIFWQHVHDADRALKWYTGVLGLVQDDRQPYEGVYMLNVPGQNHVKIALTRSGFENPKTHGILDIQTSDVFGAHRILKDKGANVEDVNNPAGAYHEFHVKDPEGYMIKIHGFVRQNKTGQEDFPRSSEPMTQPIVLSRAFTQIPAHDLYVCADWYRHVFQLDGELPKPGDRSCSLRDPAGKDTIVLWQSERGTTVSNGFKHIYAWKVKNINTVAEALRNMGMECHLPPCQEGFAMVTLSDPAGNPIIALQEPPDWGKVIGRKPEDEFPYFAHIEGVNVPVPGPRKNLWLTAEWYKLHLDASAGIPNESNRDVSLLNGMGGRIADGNENSRAHFLSNGRWIACHYFWTPSLQAAYNRLKDGGVEIESFDPEAGRLQFFDLNGNLIGLVQRPESPDQPGRAGEYKPVSSLRPQRPLTRALGLVKGSAAQLLSELGCQDKLRANAIFEAAMEFAGGRYDKEFQVELFQGGWTTAINHYTNKKMADRAAEVYADLLRTPIGTVTMEPEEINLGLPSQNVVATALHLAALSALSTQLKPVLRRLAASFERKPQENSILFKEQITSALKPLEQAEEELKALPLPTEVHPDFAQSFCRILEEMVPIRVMPADSRSGELDSVKAFVNANEAVKASAGAIMEIAVGIQSKSPLIAESLYKVCLQVQIATLSPIPGHPNAGFGAEVILPLHAFQIFENIRLLTSACSNLEKAV